MPDSATPAKDWCRARLGRQGARRALLIGSAATLTLSTLGAFAQAPRAVRRVGVVTNAWAADHPTVLGLKSGLRELGLEEGRDVTFNVRFTQGRPEAAPEMVQALIEGNAEVLFAVGAGSALAAKAATNKPPVVFAQVGDPVAVGLLPDLARPGGHVTGVSSLLAELMPKRVEILKTLQPDLRRVWIVAAAGDAASRAGAAGVQDAARLLDLAAETAELSGASDLQRLRDRIAPGDGLLAPGNESFDLAAAVLKLSLAASIPAVFPSSLWVGYGGLVAYGPDFFALGAQAARLVAKVLGGTRPAGLPVESADVLDLALNLGTARAMGISVPRKMLLRASTIRR